jgi:hypothetical protein
MALKEGIGLHRKTDLILSRRSQLVMLDSLKAVLRTYFHAVGLRGKHQPRSALR